MIVLIMGVAGAGKTTVGKALAEQPGWHFVDADDFHSAENVRRMAAGEALEDAEREPWLRQINQLLRDLQKQPVNVAVACSALKHSYRKILLDGLESPITVFLAAPRDTIEQRLVNRVDHFAGAALLDSQFDVLEPPRGAIVIDATNPLNEVISELQRRLRKKSAARR
jgi:gluconokinase